MELRQMLTFLPDWLIATTNAPLTASPKRFAHEASDISDRHADLARIAVLPSDDGERLFGPHAAGGPKEPDE
jgi:hypothetical protein